MALGTAAAIAGGIAAVGSVAKAVDGYSQKRKYDKLIQNYERQELNNLADNLQLSTYGSDLIREETARSLAGGFDALRQSGSRALIGGAGRAVASSAQANRRAALDLDRQQQQRQYSILRENQAIRGMQERREEDDLAGMGAMREAGVQNMWNGIGDLAQVGMYAARNMGREFNPNVDTVNTISPKGVNDLSGTVDNTIEAPTIPNLIGARRKY